MADFDLSTFSDDSLSITYAALTKSVTPAALDTIDLIVEEIESRLAKGLNYMSKPHRFTPGPGGRCLFCANSQAWHASNPPKSPDEVAAEMKMKQTQDKAEDQAQRLRMLTMIPTEEALLGDEAKRQKTQALADKLAGVNPEDQDAATNPNNYTPPGKKTPVKKTWRDWFSVAKAHEPAPVAEVKEVKEKKDTRFAPKGQSSKPLLSADPKYGLSDIQRQEFADSGVAMENGQFPIESEDDTKVAVKFWGEAEDPVAAKDHIIARATELDCLDCLPDNFNAATPPSPKAKAIAKAAFNLAKSRGLVQIDSPEALIADYGISVSYHLAKSAAASQYTLGPVYLPNTLDAHDEFTDPATLQKALWEYVDTDDRSIRLQHNPDITAGRWVELISWPNEVSADLSLPTGEVKKAVFPAGTAYMGIIWEDWSWPLVTSGRLRGLSMGGLAKRVQADFDASVTGP